MRTHLPVALCGAGLPLTVSAGEVGAPKYDLLAVAKDFKPAQLDLNVHDARRDRDIPVRFFLPADAKPAPVVLFSHGMGGTRSGNRFLGEHSAFIDSALLGDREPRNPNHHRVMLALSTAFWDAYRRGDAAALAWLNGSGPRSVLEASDRWQCSTE